MYIYTYDHINISAPTLENIHSDISTFFINKEFDGLCHDRCFYECEDCKHLGPDGNPLNSLDVFFRIELSNSEKLSLDSIIEQYI